MNGGNVDRVAEAVTHVPISACSNMGKGLPGHGMREGKCKVSVLFPQDHVGPGKKGAAAGSAGHGKKRTTPHWAGSMTETFDFGLLVAFLPSIFARNFVYLNNKFNRQYNQYDLLRSTHGQRYW